MSSYRLEIITAERKVIETDVESVLLPTTGGRIGIWANHAPLLTSLKIGLVIFGPKQGKKRKAAVAGGFAEMSNNKLTILAGSAELDEEIDILRAKASRERAEQRLRDQQAEWKHTRTRIALEKAINRIHAAADR